MYNIQRQEIVKSRFRHRHIQKPVCTNLRVSKSQRFAHCLVAAWDIFYFQPANRLDSRLTRETKQTGHDNPQARDGEINKANSHNQAPPREREREREYKSKKNPSPSQKLNPDLLLPSSTMYSIEGGQDRTSKSSRPVLRNTVGFPPPGTQQASKQASPRQSAEYCIKHVTRKRDPYTAKTATKTQA